MLHKKIKKFIGVSHCYFFIFQGQTFIDLSLYTFFLVSFHPSRVKYTKARLGRENIRTAWTNATALREILFFILFFIFIFTARHLAVDYRVRFCWCRQAVSHLLINISFHICISTELSLNR